MDKTFIEQGMEDMIKNEIISILYDMKAHIIEEPDGFIIMNPSENHEEFCDLAKRDEYITRYIKSDDSIRVWW